MELTTMPSADKHAKSNAAPFNNVYKGKTVLVTGHTGFKGSWLAIWLKELGAKVVGYALGPADRRDNYVVSKLDEKIRGITGDVRDLDGLAGVLSEYKPEVVFHLAAQSLVKRSYREPLETLSTNIMGTANLLEAVRHSTSVKAAVCVTSDKCYENKELRQGYKETDPLGGFDPYSASKGGSELVVSSYRNSFFGPEHGRDVSVASARAGNVIGGGDWAQDRVVPDCIRHLERAEPVPLRNPGAVRPWQHVLEPLGGYLLLGQRLLEEPGAFCEAWNFGPDRESLITVADLTERLIESYGAGSWVDVSRPGVPHETHYLALDCAKAKKFLNWRPLLGIEETVELTADWYRRHRAGEDAYALAKEQLGFYSSKMDGLSLNRAHIGS